VVSVCFCNKHSAVTGSHTSTTERSEAPTRTEGRLRQGPSRSGTQLRLSESLTLTVKLESESFVSLSRLLSGTLQRVLRCPMASNVIAPSAMHSATRLGDESWCFHIVLNSHLAMSPSRDVDCDEQWTDRCTAEGSWNSRNQWECTRISEPVVLARSSIIPRLVPCQHPAQTDS
jgi:hypothetical protein